MSQAMKYMIEKNKMFEKHMTNKEWNCSRNTSSSEIFDKYLTNRGAFSSELKYHVLKGKTRERSRNTVYYKESKYFSHMMSSDIFQKKSQAVRCSRAASQKIEHSQVY